MRSGLCVSLSPFRPANQLDLFMLATEPLRPRFVYGGEIGGHLMFSSLIFSSHVHPPRPTFLTGLGWFAVLAVVAIAMGTLLAFGT